jgi:RND family efflux transporter MFP subunit
MRAPGTVAVRARLVVLAIPCVALASLGAAGCGEGSAVPSAGRAGQKRGPAPVPVVTRRVEARDVSYVVQGTGSLEAYQIVVVPARLDGVVEAVSFDEGDEVGPARDLAVIDAKRRGLDRAEAEAAVAQAKAAHARAQASLAKASASVDRARALEGSAAADVSEAEAALRRREAANRANPGAVPGEDVATARAEVDRRQEAAAGAAAAVREATAAKAEADAQVAEAQAALDLASARLGVADRILADTVVRAPLAGVARRRHVVLGQYVRAGDPVAEVVDRSRLRVRFAVSEAESVRLKPKMPMTFRVPALSEAEHAAALVHVDETANPVTRMVECLAEATGPAAALKPGFFVQARVPTTTERALAVPESAVIPGEQGWVAFVVEDGVARRRALSLGLRTHGAWVEVLEGLEEGETLVVEGGNVLSDKTPVTVAEHPAPDPARPAPPAPRDGR